MGSFCSAKAFLIFSTKNISVFGYKVVKHLMSWPLNELVKQTMLWTTGPRKSQKLFVFAEMSYKNTDVSIHFIQFLILKWKHFNCSCYTASLLFAVSSDFCNIAETLLKKYHLCWNCGITVHKPISRNLNSLILLLKSLNFDDPAINVSAFQLFRLNIHKRYKPHLGRLRT